MKATLTAYLTSGYDSLESILQDEPEEGLSRLTFYHCDMSEHGWTPVGTANIEVSFISLEEALLKRIEVLKAQKQKILDKAIAQTDEIDHRIQQLLALPAPITKDDDDFNIPF